MGEIIALEKNLKALEILFLKFVDREQLHEYVMRMTQINFYELFFHTAFSAKECTFTNNLSE